MNQEAREPQEQDADSKSKSGTAPILAVNARESEKRAPESTGECEKSTSLHQVANWDRFKKWASKITVAEAGMLLLTFVIAGSSIVYTVYAQRQWKAMSGQLTQMQAGERPYIGISEITGKEVNGGAAFLVLLKNFGKIPGFKFSVDWKFSINGVDLTPLSQQGPSRTLTIYPGANQALHVAIGEPKWTGIASGRDTLGLQVTTSYRGPSEEQQYAECSEWVYDRALGAFRELGECPPHPVN